MLPFETARSRYPTARSTRSLVKGGVKRKSAISTKAEVEPAAIARRNHSCACAGSVGRNILAYSTIPTGSYAIAAIRNHSSAASGENQFVPARSYNCPRIRASRASPFQSRAACVTAASMTGESYGGNARSMPPRVRSSIAASEPILIARSSHKSASSSETSEETPRVRSRANSSAPPTSPNSAARR